MKIQMKMRRLILTGSTDLCCFTGSYCFPDIDGALVRDRSVNLYGNTIHGMALVHAIWCLIRYVTKTGLLLMWQCNFFRHSPKEAIYQCFEMVQCLVLLCVATLV